MLGVPLSKGRAFLPEEDRPGGARWRSWDTVCGSADSGEARRDRRSAGSGRKHYTVVGVAAAGFRLEGDEADIYTPAGQNTLEYMRNRGPHPVGAIARLRPGATLAAGTSGTGAIGDRLAAQYPESNKGRGFVAEPLRRIGGEMCGPCCGCCWARSAWCC